MKRLNLALLFGGISSEREVSIQSGNQVLNALSEDRYIVRCYDPKYDIPRLVHDAENIDVALIILHGPYGEDGRIQGLLDMLGIPYQGTGVLGSSLCMNKLASKEIYVQSGIPTPPHHVITQANRGEAAELAQTLGFPLVIKPVEGGSSLGMSIVQSQEKLEEALDLGFSEDATLLMEGYVAGLEITGAVLGNDQLEALPIVEIIPGEKFTFFDYEAKYTTGATQEICPARISPELTEKAMDLSRKAHQALFCKGYSRTDLILTPEGDMYVLETNTIPGMTKNSLLPLAARAAGMEFSQLLDRLVDLALENHESPTNHQAA